MAAPMQFSGSASSSASGRQEAAVSFGAKNVNFGSGGIGDWKQMMPFVALAAVALWVWKGRK